MKKFPKDLGKKLQVKNLPKVANSFEKRFPKTYRLFTLLSRGTRRFGSETMQFLRTRNSIISNPRYVESMSWKDVNIYRELPRDWKSVSPVMIIAALPFMNYIILPLAYLYPEKLLCKQFWTYNQQLQYNQNKLIKKFSEHDRLIMNLKQAIENKLSNKDNYAKNMSLDLIEKIQSKRTVDVREILEIKPILSRPEFNLNNLTNSHLGSLVDTHRCQRVFTRSPIKNLEYYAYWLNQEDMKLMRENIEEIEIEYINSFSFERGFDAKQHSLKEQIQFLRSWFEFSHKMGYSSSRSYMENNYTLYLHGQVLLSKQYSYNQKDKGKNEIRRRSFAKVFLIY